MKKGLIIGIIIGGIIFGVVGVLAGNYLYHANEVSYTPSNSEFNVDNVDDAINELYSKIENGGFKNFAALDSSLYSYNGSSRVLSLKSGLKSGTYLVVSGGTVGGGGYTSFTPSTTSSQDVEFTTPISASDGTCFIITVKKDLTSNVSISGSASGVGVYLSMFKN